jgi:Flp pilus assembly protein TadD
LAAAYDTLARVYLHANDPAGAISAFLKANELEPGDPIPLADAGYAYMLRGDWQQAKIYLERAVALDSSLPEANNNLAIVLAQLGDYDGALQRFSETSRPAAALNNLGVVYLSQHKPKEAMQVFQEALKAEPDYATAKNNLQTAPEAAPKPAPKPAKTPTIVQLTPWPAAKSASPAATAAAASAKPAAKPVAAVPVTPAAMPAPPVAMPAPPVVKPAASEAPIISTNSGMPTAPAISGKSAAPAVPLAAAVPVVKPMREVVENPIANALPKVSAAGEPTPVPSLARVQPAADPGSTSLAPAPAEVVFEESKSPERTASIGKPVAVDSAITPPSDPVAVDAVNVQSDSNAPALASNGDLDKSKEGQTDYVNRGIPEAGFLLISVLGSVMGTALGRSRGMIIGAALGPIIQVAVHLCGLSG